MPEILRSNVAVSGATDTQAVREERGRQSDSSLRCGGRNWVAHIVHSYEFSTWTVGQMFLGFNARYYRPDEIATAPEIRSDEPMGFQATAART